MKKLLATALLFLTALAPAGAQRKRHHAPRAVYAPPQIFRYVEQRAAFNGNLDAWMRDHLHYPEAAQEAGDEGKVFVEFEILPDGAVHFLQIRKSSGHPSLDYEARRVVSAMPRWQPAKKNGRPYSFAMVLPVVFRVVR